jgi:ribosomal protein L7Ae-like RNA K-turn-binding protein
LQLLGLARRAGHLVIGTQAVKEAASRGQLALVIVAEDAAENARRRLDSVLREDGIGVVWLGSRESLGRAVGRGNAVVVGVRDRGIGARIAEMAEVS